MIEKQNGSQRYLNFAFNFTITPSDFSVASITRAQVVRYSDFRRALSDGLHDGSIHFDVSQNIRTCKVDMSMISWSSTKSLCETCLKTLLTTLDKCSFSFARVGATNCLRSVAFWLYFRLMRIRKAWKNEPPSPYPNREVTSRRFQLSQALTSITSVSHSGGKKRAGRRVYWEKLKELGTAAFAEKS